VMFLRTYLKDHWSVLRHAQIRDPAFGVLALIEKWDADGEGGRTPTQGKEVGDGRLRVQ
jgi:hypothetical protein